MTIVTWPTTLPKPQKTFGYGLLCGLKSEQEEINPARTRTYPEKQAEFSFIVTDAQYLDLMYFYTSTLNGGGGLFTADWLATAGFTFHRARFAEPYKAVWIGGGRVSVTMTLEIIAGVPLSGGKPDIWTED